jgi:hypothetical protein
MISVTPPTAEATTGVPHRHSLEQHIRPPLTRRGQHKDIGHAVQLGQPLLRHVVEEACTTSEPEVQGQPLETLFLGTATDYHHLRIDELGDRFEHQIMPLLRNEIPNGRYDWLWAKLKFSARTRPITGPEEFGIDTVSHDLDALHRHPQFHKFALQCCRHGDHARSLLSLPLRSCVADRISWLSG